MSATEIPPYRVMLVDDSVVIRGMIGRYLESLGPIKIMQSVGNGQDAVNALRYGQIDVIVLDLEMPVMDGMTALPLLLEAQPYTKIIIVSTLSQRNAGISLNALERGASDYVPKPSNMREANSQEAFFNEVGRKVIALAEAARNDLGLLKPTISLPAPIKKVPLPPGSKVIEPVVNRSGAAVTPLSPIEAAPPTRSTPPKVAGEIHLQDIPHSFKPEVLAIGSSTGGPQALFHVLGHLKNIRQPIFLTQHMPPTFTQILAEHIHKQTGLPATEAKDGDIARPGHLLLAPGNYHMLVKREGADLKVQLDQGPPENFCRPAVDPMLRSLVQAVGRNILTVILTGMGSDGLRGVEQVKQYNGICIAQNEATSVVWGMPGAVAHAGLCSAVLPIQEIGPFISRLLAR